MSNVPNIVPNTANVVVKNTAPPVTAFVAISLPSTT